MTLYPQQNVSNYKASEWNANMDEALTISALGFCRQLELGSQSISSNYIDMIGDAFTSTGGRNGTVDIAKTSSVFSSNKYVCGVPTTYVIIEATSVNTAAFIINDCVCRPIGGSQYIVYCTSGSTEEIKRSKIISTLFAGNGAYHNAFNPLIQSPYVEGLKALYTSITKDVGRRVYGVTIENPSAIYMSGQDNNATQDTIGTFNNTTTNGSVSSWQWLSGLAQNSSFSVYISKGGVTQRSATINRGPSCSVGDWPNPREDYGTDTTALDVSNPSTFVLELKGRYNDSTCDTWWVSSASAVIVTTGTMTWTTSMNINSGTATATAPVYYDYFADLIIPAFQAANSVNRAEVYCILPSTNAALTPQRSFFVPKMPDWITGTNITYRIKSDIIGDWVADTGSALVQIEAGSIINAGSFSINNCTLIQSYLPGSWFLACTTGTFEEQRANIYKTLYYGTTGFNARITPTYISSLTGLKTNTPRDVGKRAFYAYATMTSTAANTGSYIGSFINIGSGFNYSVWSSSYSSSTSAAGSVQLNPSGNILTVGSNTTQSDYGTNTSLDDNAAGSSISLLRSTAKTSSLTVTTSALILTSGSITWTSSGTNGTTSAMDYTGSYGIPVLGAFPDTYNNITTSQSLTSYDTQILGITGPATGLIIELNGLPNGSSVGSPSISSFGLRLS